MTEISDDLVKKYLLGDCSEEERREVEYWYAHYGHVLSGTELNEIEKNEVLKIRMLRRIRENAGLQETPVRTFRPRWKRAMVASFLLVITAGLLLFFLREQWTSQGVYIVNNGKTVLKHRFPDGSIAWMAPQATVSYEQELSAKNRKIEMRGDVFFEVEQDPNRPFIVRSEQLTTKVLGTSFRVRSMGADKEEVSVVTGMVAVSKSKEPDLLISADQKVSYSKDSPRMEKAAETTASSVNMWKRKHIEFGDASLRSVIDVLENTFQVKIILQDPELENYTLTADFDQLNLVSILEIISDLFQLDYEISGDQIKLFPKLQPN